MVTGRPACRSVYSAIGARKIFRRKIRRASPSNKTIKTIARDRDEQARSRASHMGSVCAAGPAAGGPRPRTSAGPRRWQTACARPETSLFMDLSSMLGSYLEQCVCQRFAARPQAISAGCVSTARKISTGNGITWVTCSCGDRGSAAQISLRPELLQSEVRLMCSCIATTCRTCTVLNICAHGMRERADVAAALGQDRSRAARREVNSACNVPGVKPACVRCMMSSRHRASAAGLPPGRSRSARSAMRPSSPWQDAQGMSDVQSAHAGQADVEQRPRQA